MGNDLVGDGPRDQGDMKPEGAPGIDVELNHPTDVTFSPFDGSVLVAAWHNHKIRRLDPETGRVTVLVGSGAGKTGDGAAAKAALLNQPKSVALDAAGNIFVADSRNHRIRKIDAATGFIATIAGNGMAGFAGDGGQPLTASFHMQYEMCTTAEDGKVTCTNENPEPGGGITLDDQGNLYVADTYNNRIRKIDLAAGVVSTVAGTGAAEFGGDGGPALAASFRLPRDLEFRAGRLYIADTDNHRVRMIDLATGIIQTVAGNGHPGFGGDRGPAAAGQPAPSLRHRPRLRGQPVRGRHLQQPDPEDQPMTLAERARWPAAGLLVALLVGIGCEDVPDLMNPNQPLDPAPSACPRAPGNICTVAGTGIAGDGADLLPPLQTRLYAPVDMAFSPSGGLVVVDWNNHRIRATNDQGLTAHRGRRRRTGPRGPERRRRHPPEPPHRRHLRRPGPHGDRRLAQQPGQARRHEHPGPGRHRRHRRPQLRRRRRPGNEAAT